MIDLVFMSACTLVALRVGGQALRLFNVRPRGSLEACALAVGLGYGIFAYLTLALGLAGFLSRPVFVVILGLAFLASLRGIRASGVGLVLAELRSAWQGGRLARFMTGLVLVTALGNLVATLAPPSFADALAYHLAAPKLWFRSGQITELPWAEWTTYQPFNMEMLFLLGMVLHGDVLGVLFHWLVGMLTLLALFVFCRHHAPTVPPVLAPAIFYSSGLVAWESSSGFIDLGLSFFTTIAFIALVNWREQPASTGWLALSGAFAGLAAGSKYQGALVPALLLPVILVLSGGTGHRRARARYLVAFVVPVAACLLPWYGKTFAQTGDPVYPFLSALLGDPKASKILGPLLASYAERRSLARLLALPFEVLLGAEGYFPDGILLGPLYLSFLPLSLALVRRHSYLVSIWCVGVAYVLIWFGSGPEPRYLFPVIPLAAIACAVAASWLFTQGDLPRTVATLVLATALATGSLISLRYDTQFFRVVVGLESKEAFLSRKTLFYDDITWMNRNLPKHARVLFTERMGYYLDRDHVKIDIDLASGPAVAREALQRVIGQERLTHAFCVGRACEMIVAAGLPVSVLREATAEPVLSRTWGKTARPVRTAILSFGPGRAGAKAD